MIVNTRRLTKVGPLDPSVGFPRWYKDAAGTRLDLVLDVDPNAPAVGDPETFVSSRPGAPATLPDEAFYSLVEARLVTGGGVRPGRARVVLALEATFGGTGAVADGQQMVFARIRVRIDHGVPNGSYRFTHPYGQTDFLTADDRGRVFVTEDIGAVELEFGRALQGRVAPFLRWTAGAAMAPGEIEAPTGYLGDGATEHTIIGSPLGTDFVRIEGPNIADGGGSPDPADPTNSNIVFTDRFTVQGREARVAGVEVTRAVYSRGADGDRVHVFASSEPAQTMTTDLGPASMAAAGSNYYLRAIAAGPLPTTVSVTNTTDIPASLTTVPLVDDVEIAQADFDPVAATLTVQATSSDPAAVLTVSGDDLTAAPVGMLPLAAPPAAITVTSSLGGSARRAVRGLD